MSTKLEKVIANVILTEKGYVDHADDTGGETNFGITVAVARDFGYMGEMIDMPRSVAEAIYEHEYWTKPRLNLIEQFSYAIAEEVFDSGVNCGQVTAILWLQRALNALNKKQALYKDIKVDGVLGFGTQVALKAYLNRRSLHGEHVMLQALNCLQGEHYLSISENNEGNESFIFGWLKNRVT